MKRFFRTMLAVAVLACAAVPFSACGVENEYLDSSDAAGMGYDKELYFLNEGEVQAADPSVITVGDTFYLYATNAKSDVDCSYIQGWKSKNLTDWEALGPVFTPARDAWAVDSLWAPEVVQKGDTYYMYYSGDDLGGGGMKIGLATSSSPEGPFHEIEGTFGGKTYSRTECPFDFGFSAIDPSPFIDGDRVYLYVSKDQEDRISSIYGCELESDMVTVREGTLTQSALVTPSQNWEGIKNTSKWNEAPFALRRDDTYYLFYSANYYKNSAYGVGVATSNSPLGPYTKAEYNPVLQANSDWSFISGTGHCSVFPSPDGSEFWMAYHSHIDIVNGGDVRKIGFDKLNFDENGRAVLNGPSITAQPLPSGCSQYRNITPLASVDAQYGILTDGIVNYFATDAGMREIRFEKTTTVIIRFAKPKKIKGIIVYDGADYALSAEAVDLSVGKTEYSDVKFSAKNRYIDEYEHEVKIPGSGIAISFEETEASEIRVTFPKGTSASEIVILGK